MKQGLAPVAAFAVLAYLLTWLLLAPWFYLLNVVHGGELQNWMWWLVPLALIGSWGPTVAGIIMAGMIGGRSALAKLFKSLLAWRAHIGWYLAVFLAPPLLTAASLFIIDSGPGTLRHLNWAALLANAPIAYVLALPFGPLGEELGWRGFALPRLLASMGPVLASLVLGTLWTFWHVPMMLWSPGASMPSFMALSPTSIAIYWVQITSVTAAMTVLFLHTRGSLLLAVLAHMTFNTAESILFGGLPSLSPERAKALYLASVAAWAVLGLISLGWLGARGAQIRRPAGDTASI